jgi:hypothetical protein
MTGAPGLAHLTLAQAFRAALLNQTVYMLAIFVALAIGWVACRELLPVRVKVSLSLRRAVQPPEPAGRRLLRVGFGALWVLDGILQTQPAMAAGLPSRVLDPAAAGSPGWVGDLVHWAAAGWAGHPLQAATSAVWIQLGIGAWLLAATAGRPSRLAGLASAAWALLIWTFGEAFGGVFAPGTSVLTGMPGAALGYAAAGVLLGLPERRWQGVVLGRRTLQLTGAALACLTLRQAWPGSAWDGRVHGQVGPLAAMARSMAAVPQPAALARAVSGFASLAAAHGFAVNLVAVVALGGVAASLLSGRRKLVAPALAVGVAFFVADWVLVQDLGVFGGLGTDPNSMIPLALLVLGGYLAMTRTPVRVPPDQVQAAGTPPVRVPAEPVQAAVGSPASAVRAFSVLAGRDTPPATLATAASVSSVAGAAGLTRINRLRIALGSARASVVVALWGGGMLAFGVALLASAQIRGGG